MPVPKFIARDAELLTAGCEPDGRTMSQWDAARRLLENVDAAFLPRGHRCWTRASGWVPSGGWATSSDCLRHWAPNGQCYYSDMAHWEGCTAETLSPRGYAAQCISALWVAEAARRAAEDRYPGCRFVLSAHNVDSGLPENSWGTHDNVAIGEELFSDLFRVQRHPAVLGYVTSALAAAVPWFGGGLLLRLNDGSAVYSLSARAHHLSRLSTLATTESFKRGILNSRREPHGDGQDRMHLICFDYQLASAALKACFLQCLLAAAEEGFCGLNLYDPVRALRTFSWNLDLSTGRLAGEATDVGGRKWTLPAYMRELTATLLRMVEQGLITPEVAPDAAELLSITLELCRYAEEGNVAKLARHLDWAAKLMLLLNGQQEGDPLGSPGSILMDQDYANTDPTRGLFWRLWDQGLVDPLVDRAAVRDCLTDGPDDSRAWFRGRLIQRFPRQVGDVDWSYVVLRSDGSTWGPRIKIDMPRPESLSRGRAETIIESAEDVEQLERMLESRRSAVRSDPVMDIRSELADAPGTWVRGNQG